MIIKKFRSGNYTLQDITIQKGFTMIELIVVVAIIAILAAIVFTNVTQYINRGNNTAIKANLSTALTNSAVHFDANASYLVPSFCTSAGYTVPEAAANIASGGNATEVCTATNFCSCSILRTTALDPAGSTFCIDSTGYKKVTAGSCAGVTPRCGATGACID